MKKPGSETQVIGLQYYEKCLSATDVFSCILLEQINTGQKCVMKSTCARVTLFLNCKPLTYKTTRSLTLPWLFFTHFANGNHIYIFSYIYNCIYYVNVFEVKTWFRPVIFAKELLKVSEDSEYIALHVKRKSYYKLFKC